MQSNQMIIIIYQLLVLIESTRIGLIVDKNNLLVRQCVQQSVSANHNLIALPNLTLAIYNNQQLMDPLDSFDLILDYSGNWINFQSNITQVPMVKISDSRKVNYLINNNNNNNVLIARSPNYMLTKSYHTIVNHYNLTNLFILHDIKLELDENDFIVNHSTYKLDSKQINMKQSTNLTLTMKKLRLIGFDNFLIIGESSTINNLLNTIQQSDLFRKPYTWYVLTKSMNKISCTLCKHGQFIKIQPTQSNLHEYEYKLNLTTIRSENLIDAFYYYDLTNLIIKSLANYYQVLGETKSTLVNNGTQSKVSQFTNSIVTTINSGNLMGQFGDWIITNQLGDNLKINNIIYQSLTMQLTLNDKLFNQIDSKVIGYMDLTESIGTIYFSSLSTNSDESILKIITILHPPFIMRRASNSPSNNNNDSDYYGFLIDIFNEMKHDYGSKFPEYQIIQATEGQYGIRVISSDSDEVTWTGAAKDFHSNEADFGLIAMTITDARQLAMDFTEPIFDLVGLSVMIKKPVPQDFTFVYVYVLENDVWYCVLCSYLLTSIIMSIFDYYNPKDRKKKMKSLKVNTEDHQNDANQINGIEGMRKVSNRKILNQFDGNNQRGGIHGQYPPDDDEDGDGDGDENTVDGEDVITIGEEESKGDIRGGQKNMKENVTKSTGSITNERIFNLKETLWFCLISLTPQGGGEAPSALSCRLVAATWWLFGFILVASYTANLAAFLTVSRLDKNLETFEQLSRQYKVRYSGISNSFTDEYFTLLAQNEDRYYNIWKDLSLNDVISEHERAQFAVWDYPVSDRYTKIRAQMDELDIPKSFEAALRKVRNSNSSKEGYALIGERLSMEWASLLYCDIRVLESTFAYHPIAFPISMKDPFNLKPSFDKTLKRLKSSGKLDELRYKYWEGGSGVRTCPDYRNPNGISVRNTYGIFMIIGLGLFFSLLTLSIENFVYTKVKISQIIKTRDSISSETDSTANLLTGSKSISIKFLNWLINSHQR